MLGMEMLIKALGLDPEEIRRQIAGYGQMVNELASRQAVIHAQNVEILALLRSMKGHDNGDKIEGDGGKQ